MIHRALFFSVVLCCTTALAQPNLPPRAPFFQADTLPAPPQQNAPWPHGDDAVSNAAATLFNQGLADPRGLEYREVEIAVGNPWNGGGYPLKTHAWLLDEKGKDGRFAIAWNGLIYPVVRIGELADLHKDWDLDAETIRNQPWEFEEVLEGQSVTTKTPTALKLALLLRLGEVEIAKRVASIIKLDDGSDPYVKLATSWAWFAYERAVCAHERGDDHLALIDGRLLTKLLPAIDAEGTRRGIKRPVAYWDTRDSNRVLPYISLSQLPALVADCERRLAKSKPTGSEDDIAKLVEDLENVDARQWGQPGDVSLAQDARIQARL